MKQLILCFWFAIVAQSATNYQQPPKEILDVLHAPPSPQISVSPTRTHILLMSSERYPSIAEVSRPMLRLAGVRIDPQNNGLHRVPRFVGLTLKRLPDGADQVLALPPNARVSSLRWSKDGSHFAFLNTTADAIQLWTGDLTGKLTMAPNVRINGIMDDPMQWMPDNRSLLIQTVPAGRGKVPSAAMVPAGPHVQEGVGRNAPVRTYEDVLTGPADEDLFDFYATAQLAMYDSATGKVTPIDKPAIFSDVQISPNGQDLLVARTHKPYSYLLPYSFFPREVDIWSATGQPLYHVASQPLADAIPIEGVRVGPRNVAWQPTADATLVWAEAQDGGNPKEKVPFRDRLLMTSAPFRNEPKQLVKTEQRYAGLEWLEGGQLALLQDYERNRRWGRTYLLDLNSPNEPKLIFSRNSQDRYKDPGRPITRTASAAAGGGRGFGGSGTSPVLQNGDYIFLTGLGASPKGDHPFLDRLNLKTGQTERLFRSDDQHYETIITVLDHEGTQILTSRESPTEPPNYYLRNTKTQALTPLTHYADPSPELRHIKKQLVTYKRADGVPLSFTLYLPPDYKEGTKLPTVVWAYPLEFNDADTAGQIGGSTQRFTTISGYSHLFFLLRGYAILDNASMPVVGDPETVNNTYIDQIVSSAKAAIDKAVEMGVTDPKRVGVGGHSYGAFMTANLLAHSDLFRAGIARSGAYNRTLTPFGFQSERRTIWEAPDVYMNMSPFMNANKIKAPLLMIHGEADDNQGTFPIQSERMYAAIRGNGGTVRLVMLPAEAHAYSARESVEHVLYEMVTWFDKYVKNAQ